MPDIDRSGDSSDLGPADPEQGRVLAERLRFAVESLNDEFEELSKSDAERLIFQAAQEVLSAASVVQFVPTFAERRARQILHGGLPGGADPGPAVPFAALQIAQQPEPTPTSPAPPATPTPAADSASAPRWPDAFYATEAKRLLKKARHLRAAALAAEPEG